ncbi:hypothetical protein DAEQUDRAFT_267710 [Daedalea quercina L-15889]|uniref:Uncharacterized protein n=1 Tax=Daedalea quercina L-15889 TaxID=1314783 RepID=A0A165QHF3_9APHY|nr:hypothetical protein DAEQUDRAFT_267710 [Daedalea quercina L-15889]
MRSPPYAPFAAKGSVFCSTSIWSQLCRGCGNRAVAACTYLHTGSIQTRGCNLLTASHDAGRNSAGPVGAVVLREVLARSRW